MNKHHPLTVEEVAAYRPHTEILRYVGAAKPRAPGLPVRVLDWGCGRGRLVGVLQNRAMDAYGVDVDPEPLANGQAYFETAEPGAEPRLRQLDAAGRAPFPDGYFDIVVSDNVLEHVADLDAVIAEIARLTRPGGCGFHLFPARFSLREGHLMMPFVHWLPKGVLRRGAIGMFTRIGIEPHWEELSGLPVRDKAKTYFAYSRDKTFYRAPSRILAVCAHNGLAARFVGTDHPRMARFRRIAVARRLAEIMIANVKAVELFLQKPERAP